MSAVACLSTLLVVAEEAPATVLLRTLTAWAETTTMVTVMAIITHQEVQLRLWHWKGITPIHMHTHTPIATLEGEPSLDHTLASTHLFNHWTLARSAYPQAMEGRCTAFPLT